MADKLKEGNIFCALMQCLLVRFKALNRTTNKTAIYTQNEIPCKLSTHYQGIINAFLGNFVLLLFYVRSDKGS